MKRELKEFIDNAIQHDCHIYVVLDTVSESYPLISGVRSYLESKKVYTEGGMFSIKTNSGLAVIPEYRNTKFLHSEKGVYIIYKVDESLSDLEALRDVDHYKQLAQPYLKDKNGLLFMTRRELVSISKL